MVSFSRLRNGSEKSETSQPNAASSDRTSTRLPSRRHSSSNATSHNEQCNNSNNIVIVNSSSEIEHIIKPRIASATTLNDLKYVVVESSEHIDYQHVRVARLLAIGGLRQRSLLLLGMSPRRSRASVVLVVARLVPKDS
jgi:hypothetical protein